MELSIVIQSDRHRKKVVKHLAKYLDVCSSVWIVKNGTLNLIQFPKFSRKVTSYLMTTFILSNNAQPSILKEIGGGEFEYLLILHLSNNSIKSVEALLTFKAPFLQVLNLDRNLLLNLRTVRKFIHNRIKILDFSHNHIIDLSALPQFDSPILQQLSLNMNEGVGYIHPLFRSSMNPQMLYLSRMDLVGLASKDVFINTCWRQTLESGLPRTKL